MTILGIGIDLVYIPRIKKLFERYGSRFSTRVFTQEELGYAFSKKNCWESLALSFGVKEAFFKAIQGYSGFSFREVELKRKNGIPEIKLYGKAKEIFEKRGGQNILVSLSHERDYAIAMVVIEGFNNFNKKT